MSMVEVVMLMETVVVMVHGGNDGWQWC